MKKYLLLTVISLLLIQAKVISQISLINTYDIAVYIADIEDVGYKYYGIDYSTNQVLMYNTDHTLWKTINIATPENSTIDEIAYVSSRLFNSDNNIELLVVFNEYIETSDTSGYFIYTTKIVNENGVTFLDVPGGGYSAVYEIGKDIANLLVYVYDFSVSPFEVSTNIYSIPGLPTSTNEETSGIMLENAFPNPAKSYITIPYKLENKTTNASIVIYNELGSEVYKGTISPNSNNYRLNTSVFSKGVYFYSIIADGYASHSKKMIVQ
jgi:hypothetical protein